MASLYEPQCKHILIEHQYDPSLKKVKVPGEHMCTIKKSFTFSTQEFEDNSSKNHSSQQRPKIVVCIRSPILRWGQL